MGKPKKKGSPKKYTKEPERRGWPKREKLIEAVDTFDNFRQMCALQMETGYWATVDFPSKHHINKILSVQYMDKKVLEDEYGPVLVSRVFSLLPFCKKYVAFVRE